MIVYSGKIIRVRKDEVILDDGKKVIREVVDHPGSAAIIPFISEDEIILIRQYRYAIDEMIYEVPAGTLDEGETSYTCAGRELEEETGYKASKIEPLITICPSPGILNENIHLFKATGLTKTKTDHKEDELIENIIQVKLDEALKMVKKGIIRDAKTVCCILMGKMESNLYK
ncbi:MAG: NUDIX hydrolase [Candidatus Brocadiaceae baterium WH-1]|nr:MAG: NUDIX hydrolase [Candidatus Jettenia sp. AMX2]